MPALIELEDLQEGYIELCRYVLEHGHWSAPRDQRTIECEDVMFTVDDIGNTIPTRVGRKPNLMIAAIEALQLISGRSTPELIVAASRNFEAFRESDGSFWGAYGKRVHGQFQNVVRKLKSDADSRQAVITLWNPLLDNEEGRKDYPCTIAMGFRIRHDMLNLSVTMRSNDVWLGTCYDVFQFTQLQQTMARVLQIEPGTYTHTAWSLHAYERNIEQIEGLKLETQLPDKLPTGVEDMSWARVLLNREKTSVDWKWHKDINRWNELWYHDLVQRAYARM